MRGLRTPPYQPPRRATYPNNMTFKRDEDEWRSFLGRFGISGKMQVGPLVVSSSTPLYMVWKGCLASWRTLIKECARPGDCLQSMTLKYMPVQLEANMTSPLVPLQRSLACMTFSNWLQPVLSAADHQDWGAVRGTEVAHRDRHDVHVQAQHALVG